MNSLRAALPRSRNAHGRGAAPRRSIEKSTSRATTASCWRLSTRPTSRDGTPARISSRNSFGSCPTARNSSSSSAAPRIMCRSAIGLRASRPSRSAADRTPHTRAPSSTARCSAPAASMSTVASTASCRTGTDGTGVRAITRTGPSSTALSRATAARISASVTIPSLLRAEIDEQRADAVVAEPARRIPDARLGVAELGRAHDRRDRRGADVEQPVDGVTGAGQALAHRARHVRGARLGAEHAAAFGLARASRRSTAHARGS